MNTDVQENNLGRIVLPKPDGQVVVPAHYSIFQNESTLRAYLLTIPGYTDQKVNTMTYNDMVYAARQQLGIPA